MTTRTAAVALASAVIGACVLGACARADAEGLSASPTKTERSSKLPEPAKLAPPASATAEARPVSVDALPVTPHFRQTNTYNGNVMYVPEGCRGAYDLILHFHGAHEYVKELVEKAGINAVVTIYNAGNGAEKYAQAFQAGGMLTSLLRQIEKATAPLCGDAKPRRIALTAWSAGYGAVEKLVLRPADRERIDAVLLADGLHAGFAHRWKRQFAPNALQAFREYGSLAKANQKLFAISHSSIATDDYASTTECSQLLLEALDVPREGQFVSGQAGSFSIEGSSGQDAAAHVTQFRQMDSTLLSKLRARWASAAP